MPALRMDDSDKVATVFEEGVGPGTGLEIRDKRGRATRVTARSAIPYGHKLALGLIAAGEPVIKYGEVIGLATAAIQAGDHVHVHNLASRRGRGDLTGGV
jgi:altronate dehydratase small subunit